MEEKFAVSISEAARLCAVGRSTLYLEIKSGALPLVKVGRRSLVRVDDLKAWLAGKGKEAA
jgi:excisionase family DNA binding protein